MKKFIELFGWYGMIVILLAYALISFGVLSSSGLAYQALNLTGALGVGVASLHKRAYPSGVLNVIWTLIAIGAIARILL